jgi:hypothetical protein
VPNEIVIEAMIKGLRLGPTAQYFARKPPQTLEKLLQKMDEYICADMIFAKEGRKPTGSLRWPGALEVESTQGKSGQFTPPRVTTEEVNNRSHNTPHKLWGSNKAIFGRQLQEAEAPGASEEGLGINLEKFIAYSAVRTRAILQGCAMSPFRNRRK